MDPDELAGAYDGPVERFAETITLSTEEWVAGHDRPDLARWGVGAAVEDDAGRLLLIFQGDRWMLPGGMLEPDERHAEGAAREVEEETGIPVEITGLGAIVEQTFVRSETDEQFEFAFAAFRGRPEHTTLSENPGLPGESIEQVAWHTSLPDPTYQPEMVKTVRTGF